MWLCVLAGPNNSYPVNLRWTVSSRYRRLIMFDPSILPHSGRSCSCWVFSGGIGTMEAFRALVHLSIDASPQCPPKDTAASFVWLPNNVLSQNHSRSRQFVYNKTVHVLTGYVRARSRARCFSRTPGSSYPSIFHSLLFGDCCLFIALSKCIILK